MLQESTTASAELEEGELKQSEVCRNFQIKDVLTLIQNHRIFLKFYSNALLRLRDTELILKPNLVSKVMRWEITQKTSAVTLT